MTLSTPQAVIDFWIAAGPGKWWKKSSEFDAEIVEKFGLTHQKAAAGDLDDWAATPNSALALILVLDQFSRNMFRNSPVAFEQDAKSAALAKAQIKSGADRLMPEEIKRFCYLPLMHSESLADQELCLTEMQRMGDERSIESSIQHLDIIKEFGRFPHRNNVLGRETTAEEQAFLDGGGFAG